MLKIVSIGQSAAKHRIGERSSTIRKEYNSSELEMGGILLDFPFDLWYNNANQHKGKHMNEIFKDIIGYEGLYQISNLGTVLSLPKGDGNGHRTRILKYDIKEHAHTSYARVTLSKNGVAKRFQVHRLVAQAFIPNLENKPFVNHIDNNGLNNAAINLEWCDQTENMKHSSTQGRQDLVRHLGGKAAGALITKASIELWESYIGKVLGNLTVVGFFYDESLKTPRFKLVCKCSCGNTTSNTLANINKNAKMCKECSFKQRKMKI